MSSKSSVTQSKEALATGLEAMRLLSDAVSSMEEQGDSEGLEQILGRLASATSVSSEVFSSSISRARQRADQIRADFGQHLRKAAEGAACEFDLKQPFISLGCVRLHEKSDGKWILSMLDSEPIATVRSHDANVLVERSVAQIEIVEAALKNRAGFEETLKIAYAAAKGDGSDRVSANLLMVLCAHGRALKKHAASSDQIDIKTGFSRAQFGYLLSALKHSPSSSLFHYHGATQNECRPEQFIAVPESPAPRKVCECRRVTAISLNS